MSGFTKNRTSEFFSNCCKLIHYCGLPYLWDDGYVLRYFTLYQITSLMLMFTFITLEYIGFITQNNLSEKQASDQVVFAISHPILMCNSLTVLYYAKDIKILLQKLSVTLKAKYNDLGHEKKMIRQTKVYVAAYILTCITALVSYAFNALVQIVKADGTFTTVILAWPDVDQKGLLPDIVRIMAYLFWWLFMFRVSAVYMFVITLTIVLSYQYKNLQSYFYSLNDIFNGTSDMEETEKKYEEGLKYGIWMHAETLWCVKECQRVCSLVFSSQIIFNLTVICTLMLQMMNSERTLVNALATVTASMSLLIATAFFMCNAGDITVEAAALPTAMFFSGWQHCHGSSARIRKYLVLAIAQSQKPVEIRCFNVITMSYQSFVSILKASYSVFSILY